MKNIFHDKNDSMSDDLMNHDLTLTQTPKEEPKQSSIDNQKLPLNNPK